MEWAGQFKNKEILPTTVLEAFPDYYLWICNAFLGFTGSLKGVIALYVLKTMEGFLADYFKPSIQHIVKFRTRYLA